MKYLMFVLINLFAGLFLIDSDSNDYGKLWKEVEKQERALPKTAYELVENIYQLAKKEGREDQLIKAIIYKTKLSQQFTDKDPASYILDLEKEATALESSVTKALYYSLLAEQYSNYGLNNAYRFSNRTAIADEQSTELPFTSLEQIQQKAFDYYQESLKYTGSISIEEIDVLTNSYDAKNQTQLVATTISQFLHFRALQHYAHSGHTVALTDNGFQLNDLKLFDINYKLPEIQLSYNDYNLITLKTFEAAKKLDNLTSQQNIWLELNRLDYLYNHATLDNKDAAYESALLTLARNNKNSVGYEAVYCKMIERQLSLADRSRNQIDIKSEKAYSHAQELLEELESGSIDKFYQTYVANLRSRLVQPTHEVTVEQVNLVDASFLAYVKYRNLPRLFYKIVRLDDDTFEKLAITYQIEQKVAFIRKLEAVTEDNLILEGSEDHEWHSTELVLAGLTSGRYVLLVQGEENSKHGSIATFHISDLAYLSSQDNRYGSGDIYVVNRLTGSPMEGVKAEVFTNEYDQRSRNKKKRKIAEAYSDKNGLVSITEASKSFSYRLSYKDDALELGDNHYINKRSKPQTYKEVHLFTDRAIYRPGQLIYLKGLVLDKDSQHMPSVAANEAVTVVFKDANWQDIKTVELTTNAYGTFNEVFTAPEGVLTGRMQIEAYAGDNSSNKMIRVEEYKRPKLYSEIAKLESDYVLGDTVEVKGALKNYSGSFVTTGKVKYRIEKNAVHRPWYRFCGYFPPRSQNQFVVAGVADIVNGNYTFSFPTREAKSKYASYAYTIHVDLIDETGASISDIKTVSLSASPYNLNLELPEYAFSSELQPLTVKVTNLEQQPVSAEVNVVVYEMNLPTDIKRSRYWEQPEFKALDSKAFAEQLPLDSYESTDDYTEWTTKDKVLDLKQSGSEVQFTELKELNAGVYKVVVVTTSASGKTQEQIRFISISDLKGSVLPTKKLWVSNLEDSYNPGTEFSVNIRAPYKDAQVLYTFTNRTGPKATAWLSVPANGELKYTVAEEDRGGLKLDLVMVMHNRVYNQSVDITVPWDNKALEIEYVSFRDKLEPGAEEQWAFHIKDKSGKAIDGELLVGMYDASLDQFVPHNWEKLFYPSLYSRNNRFGGRGFSSVRAQRFSPRLTYRVFNIHGYAPQLNLFGLGSRQGGRREMMMVDAAPRSRMQKGRPAPQAAQEEMSTMGAYDAVVISDADESNGKANSTAESKTTVNNKTADFGLRENLNETVFFYPELEVKDGQVKVGFTMNEALTKWKLLLFAHNKDFQYGFDTKEIVTQKPLMIEPHLPRFVRQGDRLVVNAKVSNLTDQSLDVVSKIAITDALTGDDLSAMFSKQLADLNVVVAAGTSTTVEWELSVPQDLAIPLAIKMWVSSGAYADGEQNILPVLSNRMLVTEAMPIHVPAESTKVFSFEAMNQMQGSNTLDNHQFSFEFTLNPAWIVAKSIPYLVAQNRPSTSELVDAIYGNLLMSDLLTKEPQIKQVINQWNAEDNQSELKKKTDLKLNELNETPWVRTAMEEEENRAKMKRYLDDNYVQNELQQLSSKLKKRQASNGGFSWMPGGRPSWYVTQNLLEKIGQLQQLGISQTISNSAIKQAIAYSDNEFKSYDARKQKYKSDNLDAIAIYYLYVRSMYVSEGQTKEVKRLITKYMKLAQSQWTKFSNYEQALMAMAAINYDDIQFANQIHEALDEKMIRDQELGFYWNDQAGYYWYDNNVSKQAMMIALYTALDAPSADIDGLKLWLLKHKQTNHWASSSETASACYAFMLNGAMRIKTEQPIDISFPKLDLSIEPAKQEVATGYFRKDWNKEDVVPELSTIEITNPNSQVAWGAAYWQYFEDLDAINTFEDTPLKMSKQLYTVTTNDQGEVLNVISEENTIEPGDRLRIRIELAVDRPMAFIELKDLRSSGLEPINVLSSYKYQDGLSYYESTKDLASYFYFDFLPKGNWVIEYDVKAVHVGQFSNGIAQIQSFYAPEFTSHSKGQKIDITKP